MTPILAHCMPSLVVKSSYKYYCIESFWGWKKGIREQVSGQEPFVSNIITTLHMQSPEAVDNGSLGGVILSNCWGWVILYGLSQNWLWVYFYIQWLIPKPLHQGLHFRWRFRRVSSLNDFPVIVEATGGRSVVFLINGQMDARFCSYCGQQLPE